MEDKGVFRMKGMNNSRENLKKSLMEVTGGAAETDLVPVKEKSSELIPKPSSKTFICRVCKKEYPSPDGKFRLMCDKCFEMWNKGVQGVKNKDITQTK